VNIAFHFMGHEKWMAGLTVLSAFIHALHEKGSAKVSLTAWDNQPETTTRPWEDLIDALIPLPSQPGPGFSFTKYLREKGVDVFFSLPIQTALQIHLPRLVWIYDFQHVHHPELLPPEEVERRNRLFLDHARTAARVIVTARTVRDDFAAFAPELADKAVVLPIVPWMPPYFFEDTSTEALPKACPERFFFLPNHFLRHKNHGVVLKALRLLKQQGTNVCVVCTGNPHDGQGDACYAELMHQRAEWGLEKEFVVLGLVEREVFHSLLRRCAAVINPSLFEGFGLSVAEARFAGARALLSDLPVLREHEHPAAKYFPASDPEALAVLMEEIWQAEPVQRDAMTLRKNYRHAQASFADRLLELAEEISGAERNTGAS